MLVAIRTLVIVSLVAGLAVGCSSGADGDPGTATSTTVADGSDGGGADPGSDATGTGGTDAASGDDGFSAAAGGDEAVVDFCDQVGDIADAVEAYAADPSVDTASSISGVLSLDLGTERAALEARVSGLSAADAAAFDECDRRLDEASETFFATPTPTP